MYLRLISQRIAAQASAVAPGADSICAAGPARVCHSRRAAASRAGAAIDAQPMNRFLSLRSTQSMRA
jgi:hypothetical protein